MTWKSGFEKIPNLIIEESKGNSAASVKAINELEKLSKACQENCLAQTGTPL